MGMAQDLRQIKHSWMNHRFPGKLAFSAEHRKFGTDSSFIKDPVLNEEKKKERKKTNRPIQ